MAANQKPNCFVIAPIGTHDSDIRKRSDKVLRHVIKEALAEIYEVTRADDIDAPGMITSQVLRAVQDADLVVADLTEHNPNVFYELAVRHGIKKAIIHLIEPRMSKIPFDVGGFRTIEFDLTDPDSVELAVDKLKKQAEQARSGNWGETPIELANIMRPTHGDNPQLLLLKEVAGGIANVSARLATLEVSLRPIGSYSQLITGLSGVALPTGTIVGFGASGGTPIANAAAQRADSARLMEVLKIGEWEPEKKPDTLKESK